MGSLHSIPLHGLKMINFLAIRGNKYCYGNTFFCFLESLDSMALHGLELISFWQYLLTSVPMKTFFPLFLGLIPWVGDTVHFY